MWETQARKYPDRSSISLCGLTKKCGKTGLTREIPTNGCRVSFTIYRPNWTREKLLGPVMTDDANRFVDSAKEQWAALVRLAILTPANNRKQAAATLASASGVGKSNLERKLIAIHEAL